MSKNKQITIGILAHVDAGKTTLSEAILFRTGEIRKLGRVDHKNAYLDDSEVERNRGITVFSRQAGFQAGGTSVTLIDTPGHVDFAAEMERALSVIDYALLVVSGSEGVQAHTRTLYRMLSQKGIPVFMFINKMDIAVRRKEDIIDELANELGAGAVDLGGAIARTDKFIDDITLYSPELAEKVLEGPQDGAHSDQILTDEDIAFSIIRREVVPCVFGSALKLEGIDELLEVIDAFTTEPEYSSDFGAKVYKISNAEDGEKLCFLKVTGGELKVRDKISGRSAAMADSGEDDWEAKVNQIRIYSGSKFSAADSAPAGTVCAVTGLSEALPGDGIGFEEPSYDQMIKPFMVYTVSGPEDMDPFLVMKDLRSLSAEDPVLHASWRQDTGEIEIRLMGQVQLEVLSGMIRDRFGYDVTFGTGSVLYLETVADTYEGVGHFEPLRHYAEVHLIVEPGEPGSGIVLSSITPEDELARNWQRLIMTHLDEKEHIGVLTGSPLTDVRITLAAGRAHDKHTSGGDFREATYRAVRNALMQARSEEKAVLLEPWYEYEIELPSQNVGRAMTDIRQMGGTQDDLEQNGDLSRIRGRVPASEIAGYQLILTGYTAGTGKLACSPSGYAPCHNAQEVIEASSYDPERDIDNPADSVFVSHGGSDIVKWYDVPEHMHIQSVLRKGSDQADNGDWYAGTGSYGTGMAGRNASGGDFGSAREQDARRRAAEAELRSIFERTYGTSKSTSRNEAHSSRFRRPEKNIDISPEDREQNEERNKEIRAKHEKKAAPVQEQKPLILVDGYNLIYSDGYLKDLASRDMGGARDQLLDRLANYAAFIGYDMIVVFDAYLVNFGKGSEEDYHGIKVIYTVQDEPADICMGKIVNNTRNRQIYMVSSDSLVQQDAFVHGALRISSREFLEMVARAEGELRRILSEQ